MRDLPDVDLLARFRAGDRLAFEALVRRWDGFVLRVAARVTGDLGEAEEIRQSIFLRLLVSPESVSQPDRFPAWLHRTTVNEAISSVRRRSRRDRSTRRLRARAVVPSSPDDPLEAADEAERLALVLSRLDPADRALLSLRFDEGLTFAEVAAALGRPVSTIKSRTARLVAQLRVMLDAGTPADEGRP